jgi:hypothetical protein
MTQIDAQAIVTIHFRDGSMNQHACGWMHVDKRGSLLLLTVDGRTYPYADVTIIDVSSSNKDRETEMVA